MPSVDQSMRASLQVPVTGTSPDTRSLRMRECGLALPSLIHETVPKYIMNVPETRMPTHASTMENLDRAPKGTVWNTLDCTSCRVRVPTNAMATPARRISGIDWTTYLHQCTQGHNTVKNDEIQHYVQATPGFIVHAWLDILHTIWIRS
jgi:hypothetical protein